MRKLIYDQSPRVIDWMKTQMKAPPTWAADAVAIGVERDGELIGGVAYEGFTARDVNIHMAGIGNWIMREGLIRVFYYPFVIMKLDRITGLVRASNTKSIRLCQRLGFTLEGIKRRGLPDDDLVMFGMLREECRFLGNKP